LGGEVAALTAGSIVSGCLSWAWLEKCSLILATTASIGSCFPLAPGLVLARPGSRTLALSSEDVGACRSQRVYPGLSQRSWRARHRRQPPFATRSASCLIVECHLRK